MPVKREGSIKVKGMAEFDRALKQMGNGLDKEMKRASKDIAGFVAEGARSTAYSIGGVAAHVAPSLKATAGAKSAGVAGGGPQHPAFGGAEFGAGEKYPQFKSYRGNGPTAGYFLYPTIRDNQDRIVREYGQAVDNIIKKVGLD